ncbi:RteC domain-containing protein [Chitinophaga rhizosphaerae]|uniref:RteC domain-containing protein n=1 Tax=Chitinophaga rhizosphaerae TaxID=1864947 RepID=UPI000F7FFCF1|nr:RteC domain-containing protein [Chitinophaga rhizosphaerae]
MELNRPQSILAAMDQELDKFSMPAPGELGTYATCLDIVCKHLRELHAWARASSFPDEASEINYFKNEQAQLEGRLFFYGQVFTLEQHLPTRSVDEKIAYYQQAYSRIDHAYQEMGEFYRYHLLGGTYLDGLYFRRWEQHQPPNVADILLTDPQLRAPRSYDQARLVGFKLLEDHLDKRVWSFQQPKTDKGGLSPLKWQLSQSAATELIYVLFEIKAFGSEVRDVKHISDYFQLVFHFHISNLYGGHEDNRMRKKGRTPFLSSLPTALERRYDRDDLNAL